MSEPDVRLQLAFSFWIALLDQVDPVDVGARGLAVDVHEAAAEVIGRRSLAPGLTLAFVVEVFERLLGSALAESELHNLRLAFGMWQEADSRGEVLGK